MTCPVCGHPNGPGTPGCARCGYALTNVPGAEAPPQEPVRPPGQEWLAAPSAVPPVAQQSHGPGPQPFAASTPPAWGSGQPVQHQPPVLVPAAAARRRRPWLLAVVVAAAVLIAGGGVATAGVYLGWFGGSQPAAVLPGNAIAYLRFDVNPSMSQKVAALQFMQGLPQVATAGTSGNTDPRVLLWDEFKARFGTEQLKSIDYDSEIRPWLGDRIGIAILPGTTQGSGRPPMAVAVQVTDGTKATAGLQKLLGDTAVDYDVTIRDGYALVTSSTDTDTVLAALTQGTLAQSEHFAADTKALGDLGVASGWVDYLALRELASGSGDPRLDAIGSMQGRIAGAVRFSADTVEVAAVTRGADPALTATAEGSDLGDLPEDTAVALSMQGLGRIVGDNWGRILEASGNPDLSSAELDLPDDLVALLGRSLTVAASADTVAGLADAMQRGQTPDLEVGAILLSDDAERAQRLVHKYVDSVPMGTAQIYDRVDGDALTLASSQSYLSALTDTNGPRLSGMAKFTKAVPAHAGASAVYVDLEVISPHVVGQVPESYRGFVRDLVSVGGSFTPTGPGEGSLSYRLVRKAP